MFYDLSQQSYKLLMIRIDIDLQRFAELICNFGLYSFMRFAKSK